MDDFKKARAIVRARIEVAQLKQAECYDASLGNLIFKKDDLVLVYKPIRRKGRSEKLLHLWLGPYIVLRQTTPVNYEVRSQVGRKKSDIVHVGSMKPFTQLHVAQYSILRENDASATQEESVPDPASKPVESLLQKTPAMGDTGEVSSAGHQEPEILPQYHKNRGTLTTLPPRIRRRPAHLNFLVPFGFIFMFSLLGPSTSAILL
jgi:hypothetical protein